MLQFFSLINDDLAGVEQLWKCLLLSLGSTFLFRDLNWTKLKKSSFRLWLSLVTIGLTSLISRICYASFIIYLFFNLTKFCWTCPFMVRIILQSLKNLEYYLEDLEIVWKKLKISFLDFDFLPSQYTMAEISKICPKLWVVFSSKIRQIWYCVLMNLNQVYIDLWGKNARWFWFLDINWNFR